MSSSKKRKASIESTRVNSTSQTSAHTNLATDDDDSHAIDATDVFGRITTHDAIATAAGVSAIDSPPLVNSLKQNNKRIADRHNDDDNDDNADDDDDNDDDDDDEDKKNRRKPNGKSNKPPISDDDESSSFEPVDNRGRPPLATTAHLGAAAVSLAGGDAAAAAAAADSKSSKLAKLLDKASAYSQFLGGQLTRHTYPVGAPSSGVSDQDAEKVPEMRQSQPSLVKGGTLRDYQMTAVNWLISLFENGVNGILADEMGLGKTVITIAFFAHLWEKHMQGPFLVVAPLSTLANWVTRVQKVHARHSGRALSRHARRARGAALPISRGSRARRVKQNKSNELPVLVTSFDIAMRDRFFLAQHEWKFLVVDEAHRLKNFNCFDASDHQILTNRGFLFLDDVEALVEQPRRRLCSALERPAGRQF
jgi:hypothetical protein